MTNELSKSLSTPICQAYGACMRNVLSVDLRRRGLDVGPRPLASDWPAADLEPEGGPMAGLDR